MSQLSAPPTASVPPSAPPPGTNRPTPAPSGPAPATDQAEILVVDDVHTNLLVFRRAMARLPVRLIEATSAAEALRLAEGRELALMMLDIQLPDLDGFELAQRLTAMPGHQDTPVVFVTAAYDDDASRVRGYRLGALDFIAKPVNPLILESKVRVFIELWQRRRDLKTAVARLHEQAERLKREIEERKRLQTLAMQVAHHDALTGLPNRLLLIDRLQAALLRNQRQPGRFAVVYIDIDGFKPVNDQFGHAAGDRLLQMIAQRLLQGVRAVDTVARIGGDEFIVLLEDVPDAEAALGVAQKLLGLLVAPFGITYTSGDERHTLTVSVGASLGVALYPDHGTTLDTLMLASDTAMLAIKQRGKRGVLLAPLLAAPAGGHPPLAPRLR